MSNQTRNKDRGGVPAGTNGTGGSFAAHTLDPTTKPLAAQPVGGGDMSMFALASIGEDRRLEAHGVEISLPVQPDSPVFTVHQPEKNRILASYVSTSHFSDVPLAEVVIFDDQTGAVLNAEMKRVSGGRETYTTSAVNALTDRIEFDESIYNLEVPFDAAELDDPALFPPAVQFADTVEVEGTTFHRRREGVFPREPYQMRFEFDRDISDEEMGRFAQLIGYSYAATVRGESMDPPIKDSSRSFVIYADTTKTRSDDLGMALEDFENAIGPKGTLLEEGSPIRKTDRAGAGTKGTRLVDGFGVGNRPNFQIYYDDVC